MSFLCHRLNKWNEISWKSKIMRSKLACSKLTFWSPQQINLSFMFPFSERCLFLSSGGLQGLSLSLSFTLFISRAPGLVDCTPLVPLPPSPLLSPMSPSQFKSHSFLCQDIKGYSPFSLFPLLPICFLYCTQSELLKNRMWLCHLLG